MTHSDQSSFIGAAWRATIIVLCTLTMAAVSVRAEPPEAPPHSGATNTAAPPAARAPLRKNATQAFDDSDGRGWYWYHDRLEEEPQPPPAPAPAVAKPPEKEKEKDRTTKPDPVKPLVFSVQWLRENLERYLTRAIDNPTPENVATYALLNKVYLDKADRFERAVMKAVKTDPLLDENNRFPSASAMRSFAISKSQAARASVIEELAKVGGFFFFFDSACDWCRMQQPIVERLAKRYKMVVQYVSMDGKPIAGVKDYLINQGQAQAWGIRITPALVYAVPPSRGMVLSQGMVSQDALEERLLIAAEDQGMISESMLARIDPTARGVLTVEDMSSNPILREIGDDPVKMVTYLREKLDLRLHNDSNGGANEPMVKVPADSTQALRPTPTQRAAARAATAANAMPSSGSQGDDHARTTP